ncbi:MAG: GspH/FimT family pseudopilin [Gammaproteobacteria bacterium]|nr:GspH/FimT family pseudopilin [Gammaproteobacteria bacterium]
MEIPFIRNNDPLVWPFAPFIGPFVGPAGPSVPRSLRGFTLIELLTSIAVVGVLAVLVIPSMGDLIKQNRVTAVANSLMADIQFTRSETLKRGAKVILCRSANPTAATPSCGGNSKDYSKGWIVFANPAGDNTTNGYSSGTDTLLRVHQATPSGVTITSNSLGDNYLDFANDGTLDETAMPAYAICDSRDEDGGRLIVVSLTGRPRATSTVAGGNMDCTPADALTNE